MSYFHEARLPYPYVYYPEHYGVFIGFSERAGSEIYLCSCSKTALRNYISLGLIDEPRCIVGRWCLIESNDFPSSLLGIIGLSEDTSVTNIFNAFIFRSGLCLMCNAAQPEFYYCSPMYGNLFKQKYGWYLNARSLHFGLHPSGFRLLPPHFSKEIQSCFLDSTVEFQKEHAGLYFDSQYHTDTHSLEFQDILKKSRISIENDVREKFNFPVVGRPQVTERILLGYVKILFPRNQVLHCKRPKELDGMELDIYIPELKLGIEYNGVQHYKEMKHWGGIESLVKIKKRDARKKRLCNKYGINLVVFNYRSKVTINSVMKKLKGYIR